MIVRNSEALCEELNLRASEPSVVAGPGRCLGWGAGLADTNSILIG